MIQSCCLHIPFYQKKNNVDKFPISVFQTREMHECSETGSVQLKKAKVQNISLF